MAGDATATGRRFCRALTKEGGGESAPEFPSNMAANLLIFPTRRDGVPGASLAGRSMRRVVALLVVVDGIALSPGFSTTMSSSSSPLENNGKLPIGAAGGDRDIGDRPLTLP
jgi:hypothetical protein